MFLDASLDLTAAVPAMAARISGNARVLVVGDVESQRQAVARALLAEGFMVTEAATAEVALAAADARLHAVVLDVHLPALDGLEVCRRIKSSAPAFLPVLHLSTAAGHDVRRLGLEAGADGYLTHPFDPNELRAAVLSLVRLKQADEARLAQEASTSLLHGTLDTLTTHIAMLGPTGLVVAVNRAWAAFASENGYLNGGTGLGVDYCAVCDAAVGLGAAEAHAAAAGIREVLAGKREEMEQDYSCHSPTEERWYRMTVRRVVRPGAVAVVVTHTDRTAEHTRARSDARFERFVETTHEGVLAMDTEGRITYANRRASDLLRCLPSALLGRTCFDFMPPEAAFSARTQFVRLWRGVSNDMETQMVRGDGVSIDVVLAESPILSDDGTFIGVLAMISDVTERRRADRKLAETRFRIVQDASPDSFILLDVVQDEAGEMHEARIVYANNAACELMDRPTGTLTGRLLDEAFPGARSSGRYEIYAEVYRTGVRRELIVFNEQLSKWLRVVVVKVDNGFCLISADITGQKAAEVVLRRSNEELERLVSERTSELETARDAAEAASRAKTDFLSRASHELRTPLNAIIGFSGVLLKNRGGHIPPADLAYVDRINRNGQHLLSLVNELLDIARIEAGKVDLELSSASLGELVGEVRDTLASRAAERGLDFTVEALRGAAGAELRIVTDVQRLRQVLLNLAGNAIKYTECGEVTIRIVKNAIGLPSRIDVVDTGVGIPADRMEAMFEPFVVGEMLPSGGEATGLGLAIARSLCDLMGYRLFAQSAPGRGSTFSVELRPDAA